MTHTLRPELPPLPARVAKLPVDARGYPVPWFVAWIEGAPEFRIADPAKMYAAVQERRCWVCGQLLGSYLAFTVGPMCALNRISAEPPSHRECSEFSAKACPFLTRPHMRRREHDLPVEPRPAAGVMIRRNPGVALVWITKSYGIVRDDNSRPLFQMGEPREVVCFSEGRLATVDEIRESFDSGLPILREVAEREDQEAEAAELLRGRSSIEAARSRGAIPQLERQAAIARRLLGVA